MEDAPAATGVEQFTEAPQFAAEHIAAELLRIAVERPFEEAQSWAVLTQAVATMAAPAILITRIVEAAITVAEFIVAAPPS